MSEHASQAKRHRGVTSFDVAREAGVSRTTVSLVLNNVAGMSIGQETAARVRQVADRLGYRPNLAARSITTHKSYSLGIVSRWNPSSPLFGRLVQGMLTATRRAGYGLTLCDLAFLNAEESMAEAVNYHREGRIDGILALLKTGSGNEYFSSIFHQLQQDEVPFVLVNADLPETQVDEICADNFHAGYLGTYHLINQGHRRIAFLGGSTGPLGVVSSATERFRGYQAALAECGIEFRSECVIPVNGASTDLAYRLVAHYLQSIKEPPTAIYAVNDHLAIGAVYATQDLGLDVPKRIAVVGTDDLDHARQLRPSLTSVRQPMETMGEEAVKLLLQRIEQSGPMGPVKLSLPCRIVVRSSCGAAPIVGQEKGA